MFAEPGVGKALIASADLCCSTCLWQNLQSSQEKSNGSVKQSGRSRCCLLPELASGQPGLLA